MKRVGTFLQLMGIDLSTGWRNIPVTANISQTARPASHSFLVSKTLRSLRHFPLHSKNGRAPGCDHLVAFWDHFWRLQPHFKARSTMWRANPLSYIMWNTRSNASSGKDLPWPPQQKLPIKRQQCITRNLLMDNCNKQIRKKCNSPS